MALFGICDFEPSSSVARFLIIPFNTAVIISTTCVNMKKPVLCIFCTQCIYVIRIALRINKDFFRRKYYEI
jgi:hypothetical protein